MTKRALIVEDSEEMANLISFILEDHEYEVAHETDGHTGFRRATTEKFDLLIVDVNLPEWNGIEMLNGLALVQESTPIIVVTGALAAEVTDQITNPNVVMVMQKPFALQEFEDVIRQAEEFPPSA